MHLSNEEVCPAPSKRASVPRRPGRIPIVYGLLVVLGHAAFQTHDAATFPRESGLYRRVRLKIRSL